MNNQPQFTFTIDRNKRHQVQIESIKANEFGQVSEGVFFTKEYEHAISILNSIIDIQKSNDDKNCDCHVKEQKSCCSGNKKLGRNNIILFTGERGSGKTSAILSFGQYLETIDNGKKFKCLPLIDPSYFDNNNNILKSVLTTMFKMAKCMLKCSNEKQENNNFNDLWKCFDKVFKILGDIEGSRKQDYSLETLNELGEASNLQEAMQDLVKEFIRKSPCKFDFLVLLIDDLDMNVSYASQMLEQIRKFLMLDNLIILMAANLDQLQNEMRESYSSAFKNTLKENNQTLAVDVEDLATRYLLKVFPASRRIHLHNAANNLVNTRLKIIDTGKTDKKADSNLEEYNDERLQQVVLTLIWERTRLLFVPKNENLLHPIIPSNLRDLSQFVNFLLDMEKVHCDTKEGKLFKDAENYYLCQQNFIKFKNYIINNWIPENLSYEEEKLFENIPQDVSEINKHLINAINVIGTKNKKRLMSREVDLEQIAKNAEGVNIDRDIYTMVSPNDPRFVKANKISDIFNQPSNYSYGDLLLMIDKYETYFESEEDRRFINAVKIYYTMLLFETMFFKSTDVKYDKSDIKNINLNSIIPIQRLLGGTVYYPNYFEIIVSEFFKQKGPSFDAKRAFYHKFSYETERNEINDLFEKRGNIENSIETENNSIKIKHKIKELRRKSLRLLFFILYYGEIRPDRYDTKHIYDTTMFDDACVNGIDYLTFDMLSIFNNALNPLHTMFRSNKELRRGVAVFNKFDSKFEKLSLWKLLCSPGEDIVFPNSLLPFYSIEMMLQYLRTPCKDTEVLIYSDQMMAQISDKYKKFNLLLLFVDEYAADKTWDIKDFHKTIESIFKKGEFSVQKEIETQLKKNLKILRAVYIQYYKNSSENRNDIFGFKNAVIDYIYKDFVGEKKKRDEIIKHIHEYQVVSEIYNYLIDVLWKELIKESIIRKEVQELIREENSINNYYNKLWELTKLAIKRISFGEDGNNSVSSEIENVYEKIYKTGVDVFIKS